ncbi:hypothetical protein BJF78_36600 [Pseudonocardia sp. CNS-139]|nr:hypothetical protein BJF78_36600 [Pseudonocardia sp. CNS-139]
MTRLGVVFGAVIAVAELVDCHRDSGCCTPWGEPDVHHLVLANVRRLVMPVSAVGRLGLWDLDDTVLSEAATVLSETEVEGS